MLILLIFSRKENNWTYQPSPRPISRHHDRPSILCGSRNLSSFSEKAHQSVLCFVLWKFQCDSDVVREIFIIWIYNFLRLIHLWKLPWNVVKIAHRSRKKPTRIHLNATSIAVRSEIAQTSEERHTTMAKLTEEMIIARSKLSDLSQVKKLNCWWVNRFAAVHCARLEPEIKSRSD